LPRQAQDSQNRQISKTLQRVTSVSASVPQAASIAWATRLLSVLCQAGHRLVLAPPPPPQDDSGAISAEEPTAGQKNAVFCAISYMNTVILTKAGSGEKAHS